MESIRSLPSSSAHSRAASPDPPSQATEQQDSSTTEGDASLAATVRQGDAQQPPLPVTSDPPMSSPVQAPSALPDAGFTLPPTTIDDLLKHPVEFIPYHETSTTLGLEGKYTPINSPRSDITAFSTSSNSSSDTVVEEELPPHINNRELSVQWLRLPLAPQGFKNLGNTCFMNSALQVILYCPPLVNALLQEGQLTTCTHTPRKNMFCTFCALCSLLRRVHGRLNERHRGDSGGWAPRDFVDNLKSIASSMRRGRQEDAHEFLVCLLDKLHDGCFSYFPAKYKVKENPPPAPPTLVQRVFGINLRSRVRCNKCGSCSDTHERALDISLDIRRCTTLSEALRTFCSIDHLRGSDMYKCEKCDVLVTAEKTFSMFSAPPVLTIHLKRFGPTGGKLKHIVDYPAYLDIAQYLAKDCPVQPATRYTLYAVLCHIGDGTHSGHYYSFVRIPSDKQPSDAAGPNSKPGRWFECNDDFVRPVPPTQPPLNHRNGYMLYYVRDDDIPAKQHIHLKVKAAEQALRPKAPQRIAGVGATVANMNGKRVVMSDPEDDEEVDSTARKRTKIETSQKTSRVEGRAEPKFEERAVKEAPAQTTKGMDGGPGKWKKAVMEEATEDIGVPVRGNAGTSGKNVNGKRSSPSPEDEGVPLAKRPRVDSVSRPPPPPSPTVASGGGLPMRPAVPFAGAAMPSPTSPVLLSGSMSKFKPKPAPTQGPALQSPTSPTGKKRTADEALSEHPPAPGSAFAYDLHLSSPLTSVPSTTPARPPTPQVGFFPRSISNITTPGPSPKRQRTSPPPTPGLDEIDMNFEDDAPRKPKKNPMKKYGKQSSYGGRNPYTGAVGGQARNKPRFMM